MHVAHMEMPDLLGSVVSFGDPADVGAGQLIVTVAKSDLCVQV